VDRSGSWSHRVIPAITDHELEAILRAAREAGASCASYVLLRLPQRSEDSVSRMGCREHYPERAKHVMSLINRPAAGRTTTRNSASVCEATGPYAELLRARFDVAVRKLGFADSSAPPMISERTCFAGRRPVSQLTLGF